MRKRAIHSTFCFDPTSERSGGFLSVFSSSTPAAGFFFSIPSAWIEWHDAQWFPVNRVFPSFAVASAAAGAAGAAGAPACPHAMPSRQRTARPARKVVRRSFMIVSSGDPAIAPARA
jgi:hypothetical protein